MPCTSIVCVSCASLPTQTPFLIHERSTAIAGSAERRQFSSCGGTAAQCRMPASAAAVQLLRHPLTAPLPVGTSPPRRRQTRAPSAAPRASCSSRLVSKGDMRTPATLPACPCGLPPLPFPRKGIRSTTWSPAAARAATSLPTTATSCSSCRRGSLDKAAHWCIVSCCPHSPTPRIIMLVNESLPTVSPHHCNNDAQLVIAILSAQWPGRQSRVVPAKRPCWQSHRQTAMSVSCSFNTDLPNPSRQANQTYRLLVFLTCKHWVCPFPQHHQAI